MNAARSGFPLPVGNVLLLRAWLDVHHAVLKPGLAARGSGSAIISNKGSDCDAGTVRVPVIAVRSARCRHVDQ